MVRCGHRRDEEEVYVDFDEEEEEPTDDDAGEGEGEVIDLRGEHVASNYLRHPPNSSQFMHWASLNFFRRPFTSGCTANYGRRAGPHAQDA